MPQWGDKDGTFLLGEFYHIIMDALLDLDDEWVAETLAWWRKYVSHIIWTPYVFVPQTFAFDRKIFGERKQVSTKPPQIVRSTTKSLYQTMKEQATDSGDQVSDGVSDNKVLSLNILP